MTSTADSVDVARKPIGGFIFLTVTQLCLVWWAYRQRFIHLRDLRVWFAAHELVARRCQLKDGQQPNYGCEELRRLVAGRSRVEASLQRLERLGLLTWETTHITFAREPSDLHTSELASLYEMLAHIQNHRRRVPVPRQVVRFIAAPCRRCVIATILGHLLRCLYYRAGECVSGGFCKASWVADVFGVDLRNVKAARKFLAETLAWLNVVQTPQSLLNRYGQKVSINLAWNGSPVEKSTAEPSELPPPAAQTATSLPPLEEHIEPFQEHQHQKPAGRGHAPGVLATNTTEKPTLAHIVPEDLRETTRILTLFEEAQVRGFIGGSESERLTFVATAERARLTGTTNPPGLFAHLVRRRLWHYVTQDDEDRAHTRLREHCYAERGEARPLARSSPPPPLSQDALFVADVSRRLRQQGFTGDVFAAVSRELPEWTRERWENATKEVSAAHVRRAREQGLDRVTNVSLLETLKMR